MSVTRQPVHLRDHQLGAVKPACLKRGLELWPISPFAALNLHEFVDQRPPATIQEVGDTGALRFDAEPALALAIGADSEVRNPLA